MPVGGGARARTHPRPRGSRWWRGCGTPAFAARAATRADLAAADVVIAATSSRRAGSSLAPTSPTTPWSPPSARTAPTTASSRPTSSSTPTSSSKRGHRRSARTAICCAARTRGSWRAGAQPVTNLRELVASPYTRRAEHPAVYTGVGMSWEDLAVVARILRSGRSRRPLVVERSQRWPELTLRSVVRLNKQPSIRDTVKRALRSAIISGEMQPGRVYSAPSLGEEFGTSRRRPIREAMLDLVREGLVVATAQPRLPGHRGVRPRPAEVTELRLLPRAARRREGDCRDPASRSSPSCARRPTSSSRLPSRGDLVEYLSVDSDFHLALIRHTPATSDSRSSIAVAALADAPVRSGRLHAQGRLTDSAREHYAIIDAIEARDAIARARHSCTPTSSTSSATGRVARLARVRAPRRRTASGAHRLTRADVVIVGAGVVGAATAYFAAAAGLRTIVDRARLDRVGHQQPVRGQHPRLRQGGRPRARAVALFADACGAKTSPSMPPCWEFESKGGLVVAGSARG